jgi:hypothetical protein
LEFILLRLLIIVPPYLFGSRVIRWQPFPSCLFSSNKKGHGYFPWPYDKIKKPWGLIRLTHGFHSIALGSEAWVNPPKAKKEKVFAELGHHSLAHIFYYFYNNVKNEICVEPVTHGFF